MATQVCAHISYGPFNRGFERFASISAAREYFAGIAGDDYGTGTDDQCMDIYPACNDCSADMCFHDYPMARFVVGPRGGVRRERT